VKTAHEIATEAARLVGGDRAQQHGDKGANFNATAVLWNAYLSIRKGGAAAPITGMDFAQMMVLAKMSRVHTGSVFNMDNFVDQAGYSACAGEVALQEQPDTSQTELDLKEGFEKWNDGKIPDGQWFDIYNKDGSFHPFIRREKIYWNVVGWWRLHHA